MKKPLTLVCSLAILSFACGGQAESHESPQAPPAETATQEQSGTSISIGQDGLNVESDKVDINISSDSGKVEVKTP